MNKNIRKNIGFILEFMKGYRLLYLFALVSMFFSALIFNTIPWLIMQFIDSVIGTKPFAMPDFVVNFINSIGGRAWLVQNLWVCGLIIVLFAAINGLLFYFKGYLIAFVCENIGKKLRDRLYNHILKVPYAFHVNKNAGDIIQRCSSDVENFQNFISGQLIEFANSFLNIITIFLIMFLINPVMAGLSIILIPVVFILTIVSFIKMSPIWKRFEEAEAKMITTLQENIAGVRVVKAFGAQNFEIERFEESNDNFRRALLNINKPMAIFWSLSDLITLSQYAIILISGTLFAINGTISVGTFVSFLGYAILLFWPVRHMAQMLVNMGQSLIAAERIAEILNTPVETDSPDSLCPEILGAIEFDNVSLMYEGSQNPVLKNLSFKIEKGQTIGILGSTGSGKSSIVHLLLRFYDYEGSIKIDGNELRDIDRKWLREKISVVLQEPFLFNKTIKENILFGNQMASEEKLHSSSRITAIHDSIESFEHSYDTILGERGVTLSGGQRQRIAMARTLLRDSSILIFDDSLSAVDTETDSIIREELKKHRKDITKIYISHRITTLSNADIILVLEEGKITQKGSHSELLAEEGLYQRVCTLQGILDEEVSAHE